MSGEINVLSRSQIIVVESPSKSIAVINAGPPGGPPGATGPSGITVCTSSTRPGIPYTGQHIYETDTARELVWDSAAWLPAGQFARAWTYINEVNLAADGVIGFSSIPQTFTDLRIEGLGRGNAAVAIGVINQRFNADGGNNYDQQVWGLSGSAGTTGVSSIGALNAPGTSARAYQAGNFTIEYYGYRNTNFYKCVSGDSSSYDGTTPRYDHLVGTWKNTAAITSIDLHFNAIGTGWKAGSRAVLLGRR